MDYINQLFTGLEGLLLQIPQMPTFVPKAFVDCLKVIPFLYFVYFIVELIERQILKHIDVFIKVTKNTLGMFGALFAFLPECGAQVIASIMYSRRIFTKGMLLAFLLACSDEALPLLFLNGGSKAVYIAPVILINFAVAVVVCLLVEFLSDFIGKKDNLTNDEYTLSMAVNVKGCCSHSMTSESTPPKWYMHPLYHMLNMLLFAFVFVTFFYWLIDSMGSAEAVASFLLINTVWQVLVVAAIGLISNSYASAFIAIAFVLGIIGFPAFIAGMIAVSGIALDTLQHQDKKSDSPKKLSRILYIVAIVVGLFLQFSGANF